MQPDPVSYEIGAYVSLVNRVKDPGGGCLPGSPAAPVSPGGSTRCRQL